LFHPIATHNYIYAYCSLNNQFKLSICMIIRSQYHFFIVIHPFHFIFSFSIIFSFNLNSFRKSFYYLYFVHHYYLYFKITPSQNQ